MNAPDRSGAVAQWVLANRGLFKSRDGVNPDDIRREVLIQLARDLNTYFGDRWGRLIKNDRTPPFIPHDVLVWPDTREHFDVFTGAERVEDTQAIWDAKGVMSNPRWEWLDVGVGEPTTPPAPPAPTPTPVDLAPRVAALEQRIADMRQEIVPMFAALRSRVDDLEDQPAPTAELPALVADGIVPLPFGLTKRVLVPVRLARAGDPK